MKDIIRKPKIMSSNRLRNYQSAKRIFIINPKQPMLSMTFLQILVRNWPVRYQNDPEHLKHISVLPAFLRFLNAECTIGFQNRYSTNDATVQLVDKILDFFEKEQVNIGIFIDLSKAFDAVDHSMLLKKLNLYGITDKNPTSVHAYR